MDIDPHGVGERIKKLRGEKGYSLNDLALLLGIHRSSIHKWEIGRNLPNTERLNQLSEHFDVDVAEILYGFYDERALNLLNQFQDDIIMNAQTKNEILNNVTHFLKNHYDMEYIPDEDIEELIHVEIESHKPMQKIDTTEVFKNVLANAMSEKDNILKLIDELSIFNEYDETYRYIEELHSIVLKLDDNSENSAQLKIIKKRLNKIIYRRKTYIDSYYQKSIHGDFYENIELVTLKNKVENAFNSIRIAINKLDK